MDFQIKEFSTLRLFVRDVTQSRDWYTAFLGLSPVEEAKNFVSFKLGNGKLDLSLADYKSPLSAGGAVGYWLVNNLDDLILKAEKLGGKIYRGPLKVNEIQRTIVQIQDPFGNVLGFEAHS